MIGLLLKENRLLKSALWNMLSDPEVKAKGIDLEDKLDSLVF